MTDDLLAKATRALRETSAEPQPRSGLTRARILDSAEKRSAGRRSYGLRWILAIVTALGASTALARVAHYWPEIKRAIAPEAEPVAPAPASKRKAERPKHAAKPVAPPQPSAAGAEAPVADAPSDPVVAPAPTAPADEPKVERPRRPASARRPAPAVVSEPAPEVTAEPQPAPPVESAELALFRRAQRLHRAQDAQALRAWDDYLRIAGQGVLVPEARYNRALCLVRLGRTAEARAALEPFARGEYGSYRRSEASALVDALAR